MLHLGDAGSDGCGGHIGPLLPHSLMTAHESGLKPWHLLGLVEFGPTRVDGHRPLPRMVSQIGEHRGDAVMGQRLLAQSEL